MAHEEMTPASKLIFKETKRLIKKKFSHRDIFKKLSTSVDRVSFIRQNMAEKPKDKIPAKKPILSETVCISVHHK